MTDRTEAQGGINTLKGHQGVPNSVSPDELADNTLQVILDRTAMSDEAVSLNTLSFDFDDVTLYSVKGSLTGQGWVEQQNATISTEDDVVFGQDKEVYDYTSLGGGTGLNTPIDLQAVQNVIDFGGEFGGVMKGLVGQSLSGKDTYSNFSFDVPVAFNPLGDIEANRMICFLQEIGGFYNILIQSDAGDINYQTSVMAGEWVDVKLKIVENPTAVNIVDLRANLIIDGVTVLTNLNVFQGQGASTRVGCFHQVWLAGQQIRLSEFGIIIYADSSTVLLTDSDFSGFNKTSITVPRGSRDYTIQLSGDITGRNIGDEFEIIALNKGGIITLTNIASPPSVLMNGVVEAVIAVSAVSELQAVNTEADSNVWTVSTPALVEVTSSAWVNPFDDYTILTADNRIDGFPDIGVGGGADATYTLLVASAYPVGWSCDIYNDTNEDWHIFINEDDGNQLRDIQQGKGINIRVNDTQTGFIMVAIKGEESISLDPAIYGDFNNFTVWQRLTSRRLIMVNAAAAQISNFAPFMNFNPAGGIFYTIDMRMRNDVNGFLLQCIVTSTQDSTNDGLSRTYRRFGPDMPTSTANPWSTEAKLEDTDRPQFVNAQSFVDQVPTGLNAPLLMNAGGSQNPGGEIELLADGALKWNKAPVRSTIDISFQPSRPASPGTAKLVMYGAVNVSTDASVGVDGDWFPTGRVFALVLDDADTVIPMQVTNHFLEVAALPFSIRYYISRSVDGNNDGQVSAIPVGVGMDHFGNAFPQLNTASFGVSAWGI